MKRLLLPLSLSLAILSPSGAAYADDLQSGFASALLIVTQATEAVAQKPMPTYANVIAAYETGAVASSIASGVKTEAQVLLLETADLVQDLAYTLIEGTQNPSLALKEKACQLTRDGQEKRRFAAFYEGYNDVHQEFKDFLYQFVAISDVLECTDLSHPFSEGF